MHPRPDPASARPTPANHRGREVVRNERDAVRAMQDRIIAAVESNAYSKASIFAITLALEEAVANAFHHGHRGLPPETPITVEFDVTPDHVHLAVEDQGPGFNPAAIPDPTLEENIERTSGRGIMLIRAYMTSATYNAKGNRLEMHYERPKA